MISAKRRKKVKREVAVIHAEQLSNGPVDAAAIKQHVRRDPVLSRVVQSVLDG